ncbi:hypothetical protein GOODEAATRI_005058 [Goodea atripinnis]|uniref:Cep57 centrosome localisation domain-containing protein n=1 Tax=Goodea atripinnis TaxID=208336 RepID=A0ABV0NJ41_9TELE
MILDSPSKNSYIGSYYQPPDRILSVSKHQESPALSLLNMNQTTSCLSQTTRNIDSKGVSQLFIFNYETVRLELERRQAERSYVQFSQDAQTSQHNMASHSRTEAILPGTEVDLKLQSAEARCRVLEKQLDYMRKMVENTKLAILEQKLLKEEHERKLVQEKADEKTPEQHEPASGSPRHRKMPFVIGTVHKLSQSQRHVEEETARKLTRIKPPVPSPVRAKQKAGRRGTVNQNNLQLLRETQKFRNSLKQDDVSWET